MNYKIINNEEENRISAILDGKTIGLIDYEKINQDTIAVYHTEVDEEYEGNGIAAQMTKELIKFVKDKGYKIQPLCSYTKAFIERHSEYSELIFK